MTLKTLGNSGPSTQSKSMLIYLICFNNDKKEANINRGLVNFLNHPSCSDFSSFFTLFITPKNVPPSVVQEGTAAMLQHFAIPWMPWWHSAKWHRAAEPAEAAWDVGEDDPTRPKMLPYKAVPPKRYVCWLTTPPSTSSIYHPIKKPF